MALRFFTHVIPNGTAWPRYGLAYLRAIHVAEIPVRAVSLDPVALDDDTASWANMTELFVIPMNDDYVNVICGAADEILAVGEKMGVRLAEAFYTPGRVNVIITGGSALRLGCVAEALKKYDYVIAPTGLDCVQLMEVGVVPSLIEPVPHLLSAWYQRLREAA